MKMTCIAIQSSEKASQAFMKALRNFSEMHKSVTAMGKNSKAGENKRVAGKMVKVKDLRKDGSQIEFVDMGKDDIKDFRRYARKYGVLYSVEKNKETNPPTYLIYFKAKDSSLIQKAITSFVADKFRNNKDKEEGIGDKLVVAKDKVATQPDKVRNKEPVR